MTIRDARPADLAAIVAIYNATIPSRTSTADSEPVSVESRVPWFGAHGPTRPIWVVDSERGVAAWFSFQSFYGRPAYQATAEVSVYVAEAERRHGLARRLLAEAIRRAPELGLRTLLGYIFAHNAPSLALFERFGFEHWALLPRVAELDGLERDLVIVGRRVGA